MPEINFIIIILGLIIYPIITIGFQFDTTHPVLVESHTISRRGHFGYSLDLMLKDGDDRNVWVLVGAPKDVVEGQVKGSFVICKLDVTSGVR